MAPPNEHPTTDDSEAETDIISPMKPKTVRQASLDGDNAKPDKQQAKHADARHTSPTQTNGRKRKASMNALTGSRNASRTQSPSSDVNTSAKKPRLSPDSGSSSDDGEGSDINVGRARSRITSRRKGRANQSDRGSTSRTQSPSDPQNEAVRALRSHSPHSTTHRRSTSLHASAVGNATERDKRTRRRVASHEAGTDQDSPAPPPPRVKVDRHGRTALAKACDLGIETEVESLLPSVGPEELNKPDYAGNTPLHFASNKGFCAIVKMLLDAGAKMDVRNSEGDTPWNDAEDGVEDDEDGKYVKVLDLFRSAGYDPNKASKDFQKQYPKNRAHFISFNRAGLLKYVKDRDGDTVQKVLEAGVRPDTEALVAACNAGDHVIFSKLVEKGMEADLYFCHPNPKKVKGGETPMAAALNKGAIETVEFLCNSPGYNPLQTVHGTPYYKLAGQRQGPDWRKMRRYLREAYVKAKSEKGQDVEMSDVEEDDKALEDEIAVPEEVEQQHVKQEDGQSEETKSEQKSSTEADPEPEDVVAQAQQTDADGEQSAAGSTEKQAEPEDTTMVDNDESTAAQSESGEPSKDQDASEPMDEDTKPGIAETKGDAEASTEQIANTEAEVEAEADTTNSHKNPPALNVVERPSKSPDTPVATKTPTPPPPPPPPREPTPPPEPSVPRALGNLLSLQKTIPRDRPLDKPWVKPLSDYCTVYVVRRSELVSPDADSDVEADANADDLYIMGWQASVILGHASLATIAKQAEPATLPLSTTQRETLWNRCPALRSWLTRDADWEEASRAELDAAGVPYEADEELLSICWADMSREAKTSWLALPDSHSCWVRFDEFLRLTGEEAHLAGQIVVRDGSVHVVPQQGRANVLRALYKAGREYEANVGPKEA